jgi:ABC-2 type transport system permease protein
VTRSLVRGSAGSLAWFVWAECRLSWREFLSFITAGRRRRARSVVLAVLLFIACMHLVALPLAAPYAATDANADKVTLLVITGSVLLAWSLMLSQAMESVTRVFYSRADLDLILSSPADAWRLFAVRIAAMALGIGMMGLALAAPLIDALALMGGPRWLSAYGVAAAMAMAAVALAVPLTIALFHLIGPKRARLIAQIVAAVIGASFVIGLQVAAILSYGTLSRFAFLRSETMVGLAPDLDSIAWAPAHAVFGDFAALAGVLGTSIALLIASIYVFAGRFGDYALAAAGVANSAAAQRELAGFRPASPGHVLRRKEWALLRRDPWLMSQTLMQILYLLPPALLLWRVHGEATGIEGVLAPVLIMAAGQLAGALAWLAISGEDAPDLIASAPVSRRRVLIAKVEAVLGATGLVFAPFVLAFALVSPAGAVIATAGIFVASAAATEIQLAFRTQAKRSYFRRRHTSSRIATLAEAFSSIGWAATGALAAIGTWLAVFPAVLAATILGLVWAFGPARKAVA